MISEKLTEKANRKHGDNAYGQFLFWSNMALRAFPSSPVQKAYQQRAAYWRNVAKYPNSNQDH